MAWKVIQGLGAGDATVMTASRNPYYWKVDTEGNQLPYIDELALHHRREGGGDHAQGAERRDRHDRPAHLHAGQQGGLLRQQAEGRY